MLAGAAVVVAISTFMFGYVTGSEFNPQTFDRRRFGFYEIPLVRLQVTPLSRSIVTGDVEAHLQLQKYVTPVAGAPERWHLISFRRSTYEPPATDVQILQRYLDARDDAFGRYWLGWSTKQPKLAKILWPEVARYARADLYLLLPPLFSLAKKNPTRQSSLASFAACNSANSPNTSCACKKQQTLVSDAAAMSQLDQRIKQLSEVSADLKSPAQPTTTAVKEKSTPE